MSVSCEGSVLSLQQTDHSSKIPIQWGVSGVIVKPR